jgi:hypothetical protein
MHPATRATFVMETAKAVLAERLPAEEGAAAIQLQAEQITPLLRGDRDTVTRAECESVATTLRMLAEQVNDRASGRPDPEPYLLMARTIGAMAQALR